MDIVERLRNRMTVDFDAEGEIQDVPDKECIEAADEIERLREALRLMPKTITDAADEIERLRKALTELDRGINQWVTTYSVIKKTLLKIIADALKEGE